VPNVLVPNAAYSDQLMAGAATRDITPDPLLPVSGGFGPTVEATSALGKLTARAVALRSGDTTLVIVSLDLLGFPSVLGQRVKSAVPRVPAANILISSTHTHSAPDCYAFPDGQGGHTGDLKYIASVCRRTSAAINAALDALEPARLRIATGAAQGRIAYNYYAPDLYDRRMSVIQAADLQGRTIFTLVNYAIHPEVLGNEAGVVSPDLVGPLNDQLEASQGGIALFVNGAQGGMVTADNRNLDQPTDPVRGVWKDRRTWQECQRIGQTMAREATRLIRGAPWQRDPPLSCRTVSIQLPVDSDVLWGVIQHSPLNYPHHADRTITTQISLVQLGNSHIITIPGEALPNVGFFLKRKMTGEQNLVFGLTHDALGYIMTKVDYQSFPRYEYISRTSLGEYTGEIILEEALKLIAAEAPAATHSK
jgi:hypothetical protein